MNHLNNSIIRWLRSFPKPMYIVQPSKRLKKKKIKFVHLNSGRLNIGSNSFIIQSPFVCSIYLVKWNGWITIFFFFDKINASDATDNWLCDRMRQNNKRAVSECLMFFLILSKYFIYEINLENIFFFLKKQKQFVLLFLSSKVWASLFIEQAMCNERCTESQCSANKKNALLLSVHCSAIHLFIWPSCSI